MSTLFGCIKMDFKRVFHSYNFWLAILFVVLIRFVSIANVDFKISSLMYVFDIARSSDLKLLIFPIAALPFASSFCSDWDNKYIRPTVVRASIKQYSLSKVIAVFISSALVVMIGTGIFMFITTFLLSNPEPSPAQLENYANSASFGQFVVRGQYFLYIAVHSFIESFYFAFYAVVALAISTLIPNIFVTLAAPLIAHYLVIHLNTILQLPDIFRIYVLMNGNINFGGIMKSFLIIAFYPWLLSLIVGVFFYRCVKEQIQNG